MNIDMEDRGQQLPPVDSSSDNIMVPVAAEDYYLTHTFASSTPQDRAEDDASVHERGSSTVSIWYVDEDTKDDNNEHELQSLRKSCDGDNNKEQRLRQSESERVLTERSLPQDTFSFLIYSKVKSRAFFWAILVFTLQITIYCILGWNIIDIHNKKNPVDFPVNVEKSVRVSEFLAILISIITQHDVRKAICLYRDGFDDVVDEGSLTEVFPGATVWKWTLSIVLRALEGILGLVITFLLIMRSSSVLDLLLNFLAIEFVATLDDTVFALVEEGYLGRTMKKERKNLSKMYNVNHDAENSNTAVMVSVAYFIVLFTSFFTGWIVILLKQERGDYLCYQIFSQFGDESLPILGTFTGLFYKQHHGLRFDRRSSYRLQDGGPLLAYCKNETRWTLSLTNGDDQHAWNPCVWYAASSQTTDFDVLSTTSSPWIVNSTSRVAPLAHHFLTCYECTNTNTKNFCGDYGNCIREGKYDRCTCDKGWYGLRCQYSDPCQTLEIKQRDRGFPKAGGGSYFASRYYRLKGVKTYNRPVYTSTSLEDIQNQSLSNDIDFILFTGERWILSYKDLFPDLKNVTDKVRLVEYFKEFRGYDANHNASFESEPVRFVNLLGNDDTASPLHIQWRPFASDTELQREFIETSFFCAECNNETNPCQMEAICQPNGICGNCPDEYSGSMCEIPPDAISNGQCDSRFNNKTFKFDGGDCCDNTCRSTPENTCGKAGLGYIDIGDPSCLGAANQWLSGDPIYGLSSGSRSGHVVALSGKGSVLAVADPGVSIVRLFDKDGAEWKQRDMLKGISDSNFGLAISLSDESFNIVRNPRTSPTVTLAVGAPKAGLVRVFACSTVGCIQRGEDILGGLRFGNSLSISKDGESIAIGGAARESVSQTTATNGEVKVFTWSNDVNDWQLKGNGTIVRRWSRKLSDPPFGLQGYYVSLSGDYLAVGTLEGNVTHGPRFEAAKLITQVYKWSESTGWDQLGGEIEKDFYDEASFGAPWPLKSVVMKGSTLAVSSNSSVDVYSWNETSRNWISREVELANSSAANDLVVWSVDLSEDADILAVGRSVENPQPFDESVQMYKWDGNRYTALSNGVPGGPAVSISLSSDGTAVAVGLPFDSSNGGSTRVYKFYPSSPCDDSSEIPLRISFTTDGSPEESSWVLQVGQEVKLRSGSLSGYMYTTFVEEVCVPAESCVKFIVYDTQGNGLNPPGIFALMRNGTEVAKGGDFKGETCIADGVGDCVCTPKCKDDGTEQLLRIEITLAAGPREWETYWVLTDKRAGDKIIFDGPYNVTEETRVREICMPENACYVFRLESTDDASALIFLNGKKISDATKGQLVEIGNSCSLV